MKIASVPEVECNIAPEQGNGYAEELLALMHGPRDEPYQQTAVVTCYLDSSATDDSQLEHAVLGGLVFNKSGWLHFDAAWADLLKRYDVVGGLHMKELTPAGKLRHITGERRADLLRDVAEIINRDKV